MTASGEGWGRTDSSRAESTICSDVVCLLSGLAGSVGESCRVSCLGHKHENIPATKKVVHAAVLEDDLVVGGLAQGALEAGPGEAGGDTVHEGQEGTVHDLLGDWATPEAADGEVDDGDDGGAGGGASDGGA